MTGSLDEDTGLMIQEANRLLEELESPAGQPLTAAPQPESSAPAHAKSSFRDGGSLLVEAPKRKVQQKQGVPFSRILVLVAVGTGAVVYGGLSILGGMNEPPSVRPEVIQPPHQRPDSGQGSQREPALEGAVFLFSEETLTPS